MAASPCSLGFGAQLARLGIAIVLPCQFKGNQAVIEGALGTRHQRAVEFDYLHLSDEAQSGEEMVSQSGRAGI